MYHHSDPFPTAEHLKDPAFCDAAINFRQRLAAAERTKPEDVLSDDALARLERLAEIAEKRGTMIEVPMGSGSPLRVAPVLERGTDPGDVLKRMKPGLAALVNTIPT